jgi:flagellar biosynthesis/type III secretory pathway M-ring protein FliF/YscJ
LDLKGKERLAVAEAMGEAALDENTRIIKQLGVRALRAFVVGGLGLVTFTVMLKRKRRQEAEAAEAAEATQGAVATDAEDPTARYLREMDGQGWDVKEGERAAKDVIARRVKAT